MKCEKCNKNEATFYYSSNINGVRTERHLCADCAREEGFGNAMDIGGGDVFGDVFGELFSGGMFSDFFAPARSMLSSFGSFGMPVRGMIAPSAPEADFVQRSRGAAVEPLEESETRIPDDAGGDVRARRELEALKNQLSDAVRDENFEKAIELRDKIKKLGK